MAYKSSVLKVNIGWTLLIFAGIGSFIIAKNQVLDQRVRNMHVRQQIAKEVQDHIDAQPRK